MKAEKMPHIKPPKIPDGLEPLLVHDEITDDKHFYGGIATNAAVCGQSFEKLEFEKVIFKNTTFQQAAFRNL
ncbi:hypothetical protein L3137_22560 [Bacillus sonorensis]|nr:hypothetical protein [Bacillus sonorensis]MCF7620004.1 hypothetical protein [Bacillus sonorensis]